MPRDVLCRRRNARLLEVVFDESHRMMKLVAGLAPGPSAQTNLPRKRTTSHHPILYLRSNWSRPPNKNSTERRMAGQSVQSQQRRRARRERVLLPLDHRAVNVEMKADSPPAARLIAPRKPPFI